jgi:hypothetical protein
MKCNRSHLNFLIYEKNFVFFFISVYLVMRRVVYLSSSSTLATAWARAWSYTTPTQRPTVTQCTSELNTTY